MSDQSQFRTRIGRRFIAAFGVLLFAQAGHTQLTRSDAAATLENAMDAIDKVYQFNSQCPTCQLTASDSLEPNCQAPYNRLYGGPNEVVDITVMFGYVDNTSATTSIDKAMREAFIDRVGPSGDCVQNNPACGFLPSDPSCGRNRGRTDRPIITGVDFCKDIRLPNGQMKTIHLTVTNGSATTDPDQNRTSNEQHKLTEDNKQILCDSLKKRGVLILAGHARFGSGFGLAPAYMTQVTPAQAKNGDHPKVDKAKYVEEGRAGQGNFQFMLQCLRDAPTDRITGQPLHPDLLAIYTCDAGDHFGKQLRQAAPSTGLITSANDEWFDAMVWHAYATLNAQISMNCSDGLKKILNSVPSIPAQTSRGIVNEVTKPVTIDGVFRNAGQTRNSIFSGPGQSNAETANGSTAAIPVPFERESSTPRGQSGAPLSPVSMPPPMPLSPQPASPSQSNPGQSNPFKGPSDLF